MPCIHHLICLLYTSISGRLAPGSILSEQKISEQLGVSRTPVREALNRLKQAELLQERKKGLTVVGISKPVSYTHLWDGAVHCRYNSSPDG